MNDDGYQVGSGTHVGMVRTENQDSVGYFTTGDGAWTVLMVCDGMGGHAAGERASSLAVEVIGREFAGRVGRGEDPARAIAEAIRTANAAVFQDAQVHPERKGMGTTVAMVAVRGDRAWVAHVGDSRVYRVRPGQAERLTTDHTSIQRMVDAGILTPKEAESHPDSNILSRCVGARPEVEPDVRGPEQVLPGDRFVLCSDGLHGPVKDEEIAAMVWAFPPQDAVNRLIGLANDRGGHDNISVQVLYRTGKYPPTGRFQPERFRGRDRRPTEAAIESGGAVNRVVEAVRAHRFWAGFAAGAVAGAVAMRFLVVAPEPAPLNGQAPPVQQQPSREDGRRGDQVPPQGPFKPSPERHPDTGPKESGDSPAVEGPGKGVQPPRTGGRPDTTPALRKEQKGKPQERPSTPGAARPHESAGGSQAPSAAPGSAPEAQPSGETTKHEPEGSSASRTPAVENAPSVAPQGTPSRDSGPAPNP